MKRCSKGHKCRNGNCPGDHSWDPLNTVARRMTHPSQERSTRTVTHDKSGPLYYEHLVNRRKPVTPPTTDNEPATEAGRRLRDQINASGWITTGPGMDKAILAIEQEAAERASGGLNRMALAAAIQVVGLPMRYVHRIIDAYDRATPQPGEDHAPGCDGNCATRAGSEQCFA